MSDKLQLIDGVYHLPGPTPESQAAWKRYSDALQDPELEVHLDEVSITDHGLEPGFTVRRRDGGLPPPLDKLTPEKR